MHTNAPQTSNSGGVVFRLAGSRIDIASIRYRGLLPAIALRNHAVRAKLAVGSGPSMLDDASHLVLVKVLSKRDVKLVTTAKERGLRVIVDLCDNIFIEGYGERLPARPSDLLRKIAPNIDAIVTPSEELARVVRTELPKVPECRVIPDMVETPELLAGCKTLLREQRCTLSTMRWNFRDLVAPLDKLRWKNTISADEYRPTILWFGNHGSPYSKFGLSDISIFRDALEALARNKNARLLVVSNNRNRFKKITSSISIDAAYLDWSIGAMEYALGISDVFIAPHCLDPFAICKSANRTLLALSHGIPVVATAMPALRDLEDCVWLHDPADGVKAYLEDSQLCRRHLQKAESIIAANYSEPAVGKQWRSLIEEAA